MYFIAYHKIPDWQRFYEAMLRGAKGEVALPPGVILHGVFPAKDGTKEFCLWETDDLHKVQLYLHKVFGDTSVNEYIEINAELSSGMTATAAHIFKLQNEQKQLELEMQTLRAQMNPHFIFNSLNSISRFILTNDPASASEYLTKFSRLMRLILQNSQSSLVTLESDLEALHIYLELESLRFEEQFGYTILCDKELEPDFIKLPPLLLQPYVENAIWHGLMHKPDKGHLTIELKQKEKILICRLTDDGIGRKKAAELNSKSAAQHKSMGMTITANRLAMMEKLKDNEEMITINDLLDTSGNALGTEVILKIPVVYD
jgi:LytS/YehU family sensor histidine kinase